MAQDERQTGDLVEAVGRLAATSEQLVRSLGNLEALFIDMLRKQDEDRAEAKERQKKLDVDTEEFKKRQKKWDERDAKWEEAGLWKNPWLQPGQVTNLLIMVALVTLAIAVVLLANR